jgi:cell division septum initiation protein DivIVA
MEMSPQRVRSAEFKTARKGADLDELRIFLNDVADELERAQNQSTAMEARARAAVARLQEVSDGQSAATVAPRADEEVTVPADQSDTISRTLVLAQRTADSLIAEARAEAHKVVSTANDEAAATRDSAREMAATMLDEAREEARRAGESERLLAASEVDSLKARRDFLESDVDHLEQFLVAQRARVRDAATELIEITDRVPAGLGEVRRPLLSASDDDPSPDAPAVPGVPGMPAPVVDYAPPSHDAGEALDATQAIEIVSDVDGPAPRGETGFGEVGGGTEREDDSAPLFSLDDGTDDPTPVGAGFDRLDDVPPTTAAEPDDDFRFTFDDTDDRER